MQKHTHVSYTDLWDFPGSPVVKTPCFHCRGLGFDPWPGGAERQGRSHMPGGMAKKKKKKIMLIFFSPLSLF